jgi:hypothetical protein
MANANFNIGITDYDGTTDPDDFIKAFKKAARMLKWTNAEMLLSLPDYLKGYAETTYAAVEDGKKDTIDKALKELATVCALSKTTHLANFLKKRPQSGESWASFANALFTLLGKAMPDLEQEEKNSVLRAHIEAHLPQHIRYTLHITTTWVQLVALLRKLEGHEKTVDTMNLIKPELIEGNWINSSPRNQGYNSTRQDHNRGIICSYCHKRNHNYDVCRSRLRDEQQDHNSGQQGYSTGTLQANHTELSDMLFPFADPYDNGGVRF